MLKMHILLTKGKYVTDFSDVQIVVKLRQKTPGLTTRLLDAGDSLMNEVQQVFATKLAIGRGDKSSGKSSAPLRHLFEKCIHMSLNSSRFHLVRFSKYEDKRNAWI